MSGAKRAPSSSVKKATAIGRRVGRRRAAIERLDTSRPASTPRLPSKRPPVRTVSMCEPVITGRSGRVACPAACRRRCRWRRSSRRGRGRASTTTTRSRPSRSTSVSASRAQPALAVRAVDGADLAERLEPLPQPVAVDAADRADRRSSRGHLPEVERRDLAQRRRRTTCTEPSNSSAPRSAVAAVGSPMYAVGVEVVRQPPEADPATEAHVAVVGELARGRCRAALRHVDELRGEVQHHRRLVGAAVDAHAELARPATCRPGRPACRGGRGTSSARASGAARGWRR